MIKQVWVAVHPDDPTEMDIATEKPMHSTYTFYDTFQVDDHRSAEYKPAMLVMED